MFDPWLLKLDESENKDLIWVQYYAYNATVLQSESMKLVKEFLALNLTGVDITFVTVFSCIIENKIIFC